MKRREGWVGVLFAMPWILGFMVFMAYPLLFSLYASFTNFSVLKPPKWIGLDNFAELAQDEVFHQSLWNTFLFVLGSVPLATVAAISLALLLNLKIKGQVYYRTLLFLPTLVPMVAQATLFLWIFNGEHGLLNEGLRSVGLIPPNWLSDPTWAKWTLVAIATWGCGHAMVIYLAGLQDVPVSLYEAAELDGASAWGKTRNVTLPMISPVIMFNVIMSVIGAVQVFAVPQVMFPGGAPARSTYMFAMYLYDNAFQNQRMGYASAMAWVMFVLILVLTLVSLRLSERYVHYGSN